MESNSNEKNSQFIIEMFPLNIGPQTVNSVNMDLFC